MLTELEQMQSSEENLWGVSLTFDVETRASDDDELVHKKYTFNYADQFDKWTFSEYLEKRTPDTDAMGDRNWRKSQHIFWQDGEAATINVPPEVSQSLAEATGSESVTIQAPTGSINDRRYKEFTYEQE